LLPHVLLLPNFQFSLFEILQTREAYCWRTLLSILFI